MTNQAPVSEIREQCRKWREANTIPVCFVRVWWTRNDRTGEYEASASLGVAPDSQTIIRYPHTTHKWGYWSKTNLRKAMNQCKQELLVEMAANGWTKAMVKQWETKDLDRY